MENFKITVNGQSQQLEVDPTTPMLWVLRDHLKLVGTKFGCGIAQCGACTIHLGDDAVRSCQLPIAAVGDKKITTIEGLSMWVLSSWSNYDSKCLIKRKFKSFGRRNRYGYEWQYL